MNADNLLNLLPKMITQAKYHIQRYNSTGWIDVEITRDIDSAMKFFGELREKMPDSLYRIQLIATLIETETNHEK
jgi:hypothetical protein